MKPVNRLAGISIHRFDSTSQHQEPNLEEFVMNKVDTPMNDLGNGKHLSEEENTEERMKPSERALSRRSFLGKSLAVSAGTIGAGWLLIDRTPAFAAGTLAPGDAAILRFLSAAEILETDAWQQYNELGGIQDGEVPGGSGNPDYTNALSVLDSDMAQYIHDNTDDEFTHFTFINAYLKAHGVET